MDWKDQAKPMMHNKFSSCRGVSFELKPSPGSSFALQAHDGHGPPQQPPDATSAGRWVWLPQTFSRASSRIFPAAFGRSPSLASSHFCDLDDEGADDDEEMAVAAAAAAVDDAPGKKASAPAASAKEAPSARSRLGVILLDQGLFTVYKRLFVLCFALNAVGLALAATGHFPYARGHAAVFAMGNILALTLCRSEAVLRAVFWLAVALFGRPWVPVVVKTGVTAILQSLGGVHSGCGVSSLAWLAYALVRAQLQRRDGMTPREVVGVASAILGLLALSCLVWVFVVLSAGYDPTTASYVRLTGAALVKRQELWLATAITFFTVLPWLTVRRVPVTVTARSSHASVITFQGGVKAGLLGRISRSPLSEWHAFGIISDNGDTHAMLAGAVGDFTRGLISDPPTRLWVRGVHFAGLPYLLNMYRRATMVATGSGICVFMSFLIERLRGRVVVHDTAVMGRPDVAALAVDAARRWGSEVVVVTSNPEGSRDVVTACNKAGIPAFGPIWDS
ncbi:adenylate-forming reductase 06235 isoform X2 [Setaria viridis]|uniref:adenylate-forming reductase 06235 isoform X2 n=1 Tax=Setaria viridis TaxID=4556 RepID=UPI003B3B67D3